MTICRIVLAAVVCAVAVNARAQSVTETLTLRHISPTRLLSLLTESVGKENSKSSLVPTGLETIVPDEEKRTLILSGTAEAIQELRQITRFLDVEPRRIPLKLSVLEMKPQQDKRFGKSAPRGLAKLQMTAVNNETHRILALAEGKLFSQEITVHANGNGTFTIKVGDTVRITDEGGFLFFPIQAGQGKPSGTKATNPATKTAYFLQVMPGKDSTKTQTASRQ